MNYNSVQEILDAGVTNATVIRNNSKNDGGVDTLTGVSWFIFNNVIANNVYVSGDTWFGFGSSSRHLSVDYRDAASWYVYREEGTLYNYYRFLKIRWSGYSYYSSTSASYKLTYDVILWDTGDISLHMVDIPTSSYNGTFSLTAGSTVTYTAPTVANPDVTFTTQGSGNTNYVATNALIDIQPPFDMKWLIQDENGDLFDPTGTQIATNVIEAATFSTYGSDDAPVSAVLTTFTDPKVLLWYDTTDESPEITAIEMATPPAQVLISPDYLFDDDTITGIEDADVVASSDVLFAISTDEGLTWKAHNGTTWITLNSVNSGMNAETMNGISLQDWETIYTGNTKFRIRAYIPALTSYIESVIINYLNEEQQEQEEI